MNDYTSRKQQIQLEDYRDQLWTCLMCSCGICLYECPAFKITGLESAGPRGRNHIALAILDGELSIKDLPDLLIYACTTCRYCETICPQNTPFIVRTTNKGRKLKVSGSTTSELLRAMKVESGIIPSTLIRTLKSFTMFGNPYKGSKAEKDKWVQSLGITPMNVEGKDAIFYAGAIIPYEEKATKAVKAVINVLSNAKITLGMLGGEELSSGGLVRPTGEEGLFEMFVDHLMKIFIDKKIERVICFSPHDYYAFTNYYSDLGIKFEHYTQTIADLIKQRKIKFNNIFSKNVTYQDPCYLGRGSGVYDAPREILNEIPGLKYVEMDKTRLEAHCCGGGGTGLWIELAGVDIDKRRADEIKETGVEVVATACPICGQMLDFAMKSRDYSIEVLNISEILQKVVI